MAPPKTVPDIDQTTGPDGPSPFKSGKLEDIEFRLLEAGAKSKENRNREADQRYRFRWVAVITGLLLILAMSVLLWHVTDSFLVPNYSDVAPHYVVAVFVAPIVSMTTLAIAILVAAFRGFAPTDGENLSSLASDAVRTGISGD